MPSVAEEVMQGTLLPQAWYVVLDEAAVSVSWSASGRYMAAASASGAVFLFEAETGRQLKRWDAHRFAATLVAWHPDEDLLASAGHDGKVLLWKPEGETSHSVLECGSAWVEHLAWSPSGSSWRQAADAHYGYGRRMAHWLRSLRSSRTPSQASTGVPTRWSWSLPVMARSSSGRRQLARQSGPSSGRARCFALPGARMVDISATAIRTPPSTSGSWPQARSCRCPATP